MKKVLTILCPFILILLIGCAARPPENLITAADRRQQAFDSDWVVYTLPEMDRVSVANITYKEGLTMDVYYPPDFSFRSRLPAVVFVNSGIRHFGGDFRDQGQQISWGQLTAASGLIAITGVYDLLKGIAEDDMPILNFVDGVKCQAVLEAVEKSAQSGE